MNDTDIAIRVIYIIGAVAVLATILWMAFTYEKAPEIVYLLPDGVTCERSFMTGSLGKATHEFSRCSDGYIHINPEKYRRVRKT